MFGICTLFCLILMNVLSGTNGVGEEADNGKGKNGDLLFGEMWRKAFEANRHNGKEREEKEEMAKTKVKEVQREEEMEKEEVAEERTKRVKEEQREERGNKLWKKVKTEPIEDEEKRDGEKCQKQIKKEPKIEENKWEDLQKTEEDSDQQQDDNSASDQSDSDQSADDDKKIEYGSKKVQKKKPENEERKRAIIEKFDKMRDEKKNENGNRRNFEQKIARELGTCRSTIYKWKKELNQKKKPESEEEKWEITEKFDKMRKEYQIRGNVERGDRVKIELEIAKELGTSRANIFKWKKERSQKSKPSEENEERKWEMIKKFDKMRKKYKMKGANKRGDLNKIEQEIAKELGISRKNIYKWKKELNQTKSENTVGNNKTKLKIIKEFDKMRNENKNGKGNRRNFEQKIARGLGTGRSTIYKWKKELRRPENEEKREIIKNFDKMRKEHKNRKEYKANDRIKIEQKIAKKLGTHRDGIFGWKREFEKSKPLDKYTDEQKGQIIDSFVKICVEFENKFNRKAGEQIKGEIARKFGVSGRTIDRWKKKEH